MKSERIAVIDLGTNTFHLLIAETDGRNIQPVYAEKVPVRIGKGGINHGFISEEACERALNAMNDFRKIITDYKAERIYATATSAFRNARNGMELAEKIKKVTGINISIISGDREAELICYGVREALELGNEKSLIIDIGGGSVEFIIADGKTIYWKQSFEIGGQRLMELFQKNDPIGEDEIEALQNYISEKLLPLETALSEFPTSILVGSAGSFETFSDIDLNKKGFKHSIETQKEYEIDLPDFELIYKDLIRKERAARMQIPGMIELRVDMIVVAAVLVRFILNRFMIGRMRVSSYSLKEGVMSRIVRGETLE
jgi:exopolyphosphatase/guanosine-5'-triphosphate,3'-diphosphate pyrophosphatase